MRLSPFRATIAIAGLVVLACMATEANAQTAVLSVRAHTGNDTLYVGMPGAVVVSVEEFEGCLSYVNYYCQWRYDTGPPFNNLSPPDNPVFSDAADTAFEIHSVFTGFGPDTTFLGMVDFGGPQWIGSGELFRYNFTPTQERTLTFDMSFSFGPPSLQWELVDCSANLIPTVLDTPSLAVVPCSAGNLDGGDANFDRVVNSADIIYLVNHVFKSGIQPVIRNMGDTDCTNTITAADIIFLVGYVFKSLAPPCDPCSTVVNEVTARKMLMLK